MEKEISKEVIKFPSVTINKIKFNDGTEIPIKKDDIIVFVGANNVGKSRALKDIRNDLLENSKKKIVINEIGYEATNFTDELMKKYFEEHFSMNSYGDYDVPINDNYSQCYSNHNFTNVAAQKRIFYKVLFSFLSTESRLNMTCPISYSHIQDKFNFHIMKKLETNKQSICRLNKILINCFNKAIDISEDEIQNSVVKLYKFGTENDIDKTINSNTREAKQKLKELENLNEQGDGIRSAVAILSSLIANDHSLYLIDEPETFLHPPQARLLGNNIVELSENKQCFISTHNIDLIRGILEKKSSRVKIIKINRIGNNNTFSHLDNESLIKIANDKNLKYSNILNGLFYHQVVLCENESDCKFYSAVLESLDSNLYQNTLFCAVGGKDQFKIVIPLLKKADIDYLIIADLDLINDKQKLKALLNAIDSGVYDNIKDSHNVFLDLFQAKTCSGRKKQSVIKEEINRLFTDDEYLLSETANKIKDILKDISNLKILKTSGKGCLPSGPCVKNFNNVIKYLNSYNIYVVECGEIERFIIEVGAHGDAWVESVFEKFPTLEEPEYDSVKLFLKKVFKI